MSTLNHSEFFNDASGTLIRREEVTDRNGLTYEKYQFITAMHAVSELRNPTRGFDNSIDAITVKTWKGPSQASDSEVPLQLLDVSQVYDNGQPKDIVIITARTINDSRLPASSTPLGTDKLHPWINNPTRVTTAGYPSGANVNDLMIAEIEADSITPIAGQTAVDADFRANIKEGSSWFIPGMSGSEFCIQTPEFPAGVVTGVGTSYSGITGGSLFGITKFPDNIRQQAETSWNIR